MNPGAVKFFDALFFVHWQPRNQRKTLQLVLKSLNSQKIGFKKRGSAMPITRPQCNVFPHARLRHEKAITSAVTEYPVDQLAPQAIKKKAYYQSNCWEQIRFHTILTSGCF